MLNYIIYIYYMTKIKKSKTKKSKTKKLKTKKSKTKKSAGSIVFGLPTFKSLKTLSRIENKKRKIVSRSLKRKILKKILFRFLNGDIKPNIYNYYKDKQIPDIITSTDITPNKAIIMAPWDNVNSKTRQEIQLNFNGTNIKIREINFRTKELIYESNNHINSIPLQNIDENGDEEPIIFTAIYSENGKKENNNRNSIKSLNNNHFNRKPSKLLTNIGKGIGSTIETLFGVVPSIFSPMRRKPPGVPISGLY